MMEALFVSDDFNGYCIENTENLMKIWKKNFIIEFVNNN